MLPIITRFNDSNWFPTLFNDLFDDNYSVPAIRHHGVNAPAVNVLEGEKEYKVEVAAPGMTKDDFQVKVDNDNNLVISLEKKEELNDKDAKESKKHDRYLRREFSYSKYQQAFTLPDEIQKDKISAKMTDGVLTIVIPKTEPAPVVDTSRTIEIK
ncbi:MAG: Hsp20/alpha crystallin family protein [Bacteroidales bacterium]|nr:Hsp20/alpha crystallin family protein [Bacteroidales bacterium]